ncbi:MAG TPA: hypothetical protein VN719_04140 [Gemmatimonadales bacterium]|nr:hypothetical protein [Gemmatimonadales bacterium]
MRRVPLDFDWPRKKTWDGFLNPYYAARQECEACEGSGYAPNAKQFKDEWYGHAPFDPVAYGAQPLTVDHPGIVAMATRNVEHSPAFYENVGKVRFSRDVAIRRECRRLFEFMSVQWSHHLIQADVDALVAAHRLMDFTHVPRTEEQRQVVEAKIAAGGNSWLPEPNGYVPTAEEVNNWSIGGLGHDSTNCYICVTARCEREGAPVLCTECGGSGDQWPSKAHQHLAEELWKPIDPPTGEGYQLWETTTEGSPQSPVFASLDELCAWCETNASTFGRYTATASEWRDMLEKNFVHARQDNVVFM